MTGDYVPAYYERGLIVQVGDKIRCHVCGCLFKSLGVHAARTHGLSADEYRNEFQVAGGLDAPSTSRLKSVLHGPRLTEWMKSKEGRAMVSAANSRQFISQCPICSKDYKRKPSGRATCGDPQCARLAIAKWHTGRKLSEAAKVKIAAFASGRKRTT